MCGSFYHVVITYKTQSGAAEDRRKIEIARRVYRPGNRWGAKRRHTKSPKEPILASVQGFDDGQSMLFLYACADVKTLQMMPLSMPWN